MYDKASTEPIDVIIANECSGYLNLTTERFRALANEIELLRADACVGWAQVAELWAALRPFAELGRNGLPNQVDIDHAKRIIEGK